MSATKLFFALFFCISYNAHAIDYQEFFRNIGVGSLAGMLKIIATQPLICIKNMRQQGKPIPFSLRKLYRGFGINVVCMMPTTSLQIANNKALEAVIPGDSTAARAKRAFIAGLSSSLSSSPTELVVLFQQNNTEKNLKESIEHLHKSRGPRVFARALHMTAMREGVFTPGYMVLYPLIRETLEKGIENKAITIGSASALTALAIALFTQPIDTIKTNMQADYKKKIIPSVKSAVKHIYTKHGFSRFYRGLIPRAMRIAPGIPIVYGVRTFFSRNKT